MPIFNYEVLDRTGLPLTGKIEADHEWSAAARLRKMGYTVVELAEAKESLLKQLMSSGKKVEIAELCLFSRLLASMLTAGIPLTRSLYTVGKQSEGTPLGKVCVELARNVEGGITFSESLRAYPAVFPAMYADMVKAGEVSGSLEEMLTRLAEQLERDKILRDNIRSATFYPMAVLVFSGFIVLGLMIFVVPVFTAFFPPGLELPLATKMVMWLSNSLRSFWYVYLLGLPLVFIGLRLYLLGPGGQRVWEALKFRLPVFGILLKKAAIARFARTFSTLLAGGIPVVQALDATGPATGSAQLEATLAMASQGILEGQSIARPLEESGFFPPVICHMVAIGEETGELSPLLARMANFYEEEVATMTKGLLSMLEPFMLMGVGLVIGGILIAIYMPIFAVVTSMGK